MFCRDTGNSDACMGMPKPFPPRERRRRLHRMRMVGGGVSRTFTASPVMEGFNGDVA